MDMNNYPSNSDASRIRKSDDISEKRVQLPTNREVAKHSGGGYNVIKKVFADDIRGAKEDFMEEFFWPTVKDTFVSFSINFIESLVYGSARRGRYSNNGKINYSGIYSGVSRQSRVINLNDERPERSVRSIGQPGLYYQDIVMTRPEIDDVIWRLKQVEDQYGLTSITDLYDAIGKVIGN